MNEWMMKWMSEWTNEWMNERMNERTNEWTNEWMNERMNEWTNEWMNKWMNEWMNLQEYQIPVEHGHHGVERIQWHVVHHPGCKHVLSCWKHPMILTKKKKC